MYAHVCVKQSHFGQRIDLAGSMRDLAIVKTEIVEGTLPRILKLSGLENSLIQGVTVKCQPLLT